MELSYERLLVTSIILKPASALRKNLEIANQIIGNILDFDVYWDFDVLDVDEPAT